MRERNKLDAAISNYARLESDYRNSIEMIELASAEGEGGLVAEAEASLKALQARAGELEMQSLLSGEADGNDAYLEIHAGAGGTESQDWASMLLRMYTRWA
jgi:peptide chain release factor 2